MRNSRKRQEVGGLASHVMIDLTHGYRSNPSLQLSPLRDGKWQNYSFSNRTGALDIDGATVRLSLDVADRSPFLAAHELMDIRNKPIELGLADDTELSAEIGAMHHLGEFADIRLYHWNWTTRKTPLLWVGRLGGHFPTFGNLSIVEKGDKWVRAKHGGFRLFGRHTWNLLPIKDDTGTTVVIEGGDDAVTRDSLLSDFYALQFAMGGGLQLDYLVGIDESWNAVGALSLASFERPRSRYRPPTAHRMGESEIWLPELFRLVALKLAGNESLPLEIAITSYLDSKSDHLDGAYLKAQVGLEAVANRIASAGTPDLLVKDENDWKAWISTLEPELASKLRSPEHFQMVLGKFISAKYAPSGSVVKKALKTYGVSLPKYVLEEIKNRNLPAHGFLMNKTKMRELDKDVRRLEMIQTVVAALVSLYVGYSGPLLGYDVTEDGGRDAPSWWPSTAEKAPLNLWHVAERSVLGPFPSGQSDTASQAEAPRAFVEHAIRERAYFLWKDRRGKTWWDATSNWIEAEASMRREIVPT
jgi:hypothetical protein